MFGWMFYALVAVLLYGLTGLLQKMSTNHISASASVVWCTVGYLMLLPYLLATSGPLKAKFVYLLVAFLVGVTSQLGTWFLFASLERGAKASVAVPLTALYPVLTIVFALIFLSERMTALQWLGIVLALNAGAMMSYEKSDPATDKSS